jgi:hypothetical protein
MALPSVQDLDCRSLSRRDGAILRVSTTTATKKKIPT